MSQSFDNPYSKMTFDPTEFDKVITKTRESFDATIQEAGMVGGMAAGQTGMNPNRVTADVYSKAMGNRDATVAGIEGQKAQAKTAFETQKQQLVANAEAEFQKNKPGFLDYLSSGLQLGGSIASTIMTAGATAPSIAGSLAGIANKFNYKGPSSGGGGISKQTPVIETDPSKNSFGLDVTKTNNYWDNNSFSLFGNKKKYNMGDNLFQWK